MKYAYISAAILNATAVTMLICSAVGAAPKVTWESNIKDPAVRDFREAVYSALWDHSGELSKTNKRVAALEVKVSKLLKAALHNNERVINLEKADK